MDIKVYIGGHQATTEHFINTLEKNISTLESENIFFIPPDNDVYHSLFKASKAIRHGGDVTTVQQEFLQQFTTNQNIKTLLIIDNRSIGTEHRPFEKELFYPRPGGVIKQVQALFEDFPLRLFVETRNIATLLPSYYYNIIFDNISSSFDDFLAAINLEDLRWSSFIDRAQGRGTPVHITTWRYEDYPYIWRDVAGAITGVTKYQDFTGPAEHLDLSVNLQAALLFYKYTQKYPIQSENEFKTLKQLFLEHDPGASPEIESPNWSSERIQTLTHSYDDDWYYIERMENVETIQPRIFTHARSLNG